MKNKEFVKGVKGYGYSIVDFEVVYAIFNELGYLIAYVSKVTRCEFDLYYKKELGRELFSLIVVYSATPIPDREEEEKDEKNLPNWMTRWLGEPFRDCERETSDYEVGRQDMSDKYVFKFTLEQAEVINKLIGFKLSECVAWKASDYEETIELSRSLNRQIGYFQGLEKSMKVEK